MTEHEKVHVICENLCLKEGMTKEQINELVNTKDTELKTNLESQINSLASGSPLVANSVSGMTDTSRVYVNTTNGHWYYYNGSNWIDGGVYQAVEVADDSITIYKLDTLLEGIFTKEYENVDVGSYVSGNAKYVNNNVIENLADQNYRYYNVNLDSNKLYEFGGFNCFRINAIIIYDSNDNNKIIYYTPVSNVSNRYENVKLRFKTNKSGLKAYINTIDKTDIANLRPEFLILPTLSSIKEITQNKKENYIEKLKDLQNYIIEHVSNTINNTPRFTYNSSVDCKTSVYKLSKGTKYKVNSANIYSNCGLTIVNENLQISYESNTQNVGNQPVKFTYEFTASDNGYALLQYINSANYKIESEIYIVDNSNKYKSMKWCVMGDSLTDSNVNSSVKKYYSYVQDDLKINVQNLGQSGCGYKRKYSNGNNFVEQSLLIDNDTDVVTIFGSFNDHNIYDSEGLGEITDTTTDTVLGCVNKTLQNIITNRPNAKIGIILPTPWNSPSSNPYNPRTIDIEYIEGIRTLARKYSIPVLDLFYESNMHPWDSNFRTMFYVNGDGTHPNSEGNKRFAYQIEEFIKKLI